MRGHLQQRSRDTWRLKVYVGRSADGKRRYLERTVHGSRREAERELARLVVEVDEGRHVAAAPMTVGELLDRWLDLKAMTVEASTVNGYRWITEHFVRPAFGDRKVASIRTLELDHWYQQLRAGGGAGGRPLSGRTVRLCHTVMRQSLEQARKWGLIARNPAVDATPPTARRTEIKPPTIQQVHDLLEAAFEFDPDFGVYLWLLAVTGCRRGEACALRWTNIHWDPAEIAISRSIAQVDQKRIEKDTKTHQARRVAIDQATRELLREFHLAPGNGRWRSVSRWPTMPSCSPRSPTAQRLGGPTSARTGSAASGPSSASTTCAFSMSAPTPARRSMRTYDRRRSRWRAWIRHGQRGRSASSTGERW